jgi:hypothetical protein
MQLSRRARVWLSVYFGGILLLCLFVPIGYGASIYYWGILCWLWGWGDIAWAVAILVLVIYTLAFVVAWLALPLFRKSDGTR